MAQPPIFMTPDRLWQSILPWSFFQNARFAIFNIDGRTSRPDVERAVIDTASYGKQLGRMGDAMAVLLRHMDRSKLAAEEIKALNALETLLDEINDAKQAALR